MGFLQLSDGTPDFSQAVISTWFNIPQASLDAARAQFDSASAEFPNTNFSLIGVVPLITFGPNSETYENHSGVGGAVISSGAMSPCVIGVSCGNTDDGTYRNVLYARMQYSSGALPAAFPNTVYNDFFQVGAQLPPCQVFGNQATPNYVTVSGDTWHHALISFDLRNGCSSSFSGSDLTIDTTSKFYWAFDDVDHNGAYLWPNTPEIIIPNGAVQNGIFSDLMIQIHGSAGFSAGNIPTNGKAIGIPSTSANVAHVYDVEMANTVVFTGVTLDTSVESNRRAFVTANGRPADVSLARALLGKAPIIEFSKVKNWMIGKNTGSAGNFAKSGTVSSYSIGPSL